MKRIFMLLTILGLGILLAAGCSTTSSGGATIPETEAAQGVGSAANQGLAADNSILDGTGISAAGIGASQDFSSVTREAGWFHATNSFATGVGVTVTEDLYFRVWDTTNTEVTEVALLNASLTINQLRMYGTISYIFDSGSGDFTITAGNGSSDPLTAVYAPSRSLDGQITYTAEYDGTEYQVSYDYGSISTNTSGYPDGSVSWALTVNNSQQYAGTIVFNGTKFATLNFTTGATGSYTIDLETGNIVI